MKKYLSVFLALIILIALSGCYSSDNDSEDYDKLEIKIEELEEELEETQDICNDSEDKIIYLTDSLKELFEFHKKTTKAEPLSFKDVWTVQDYFDFSLKFNEEDNTITYSLKTKEKDSLSFWHYFNSDIKFLFVGFLRSDGKFITSEDHIKDGDVALQLPDYNYSYEVYVLTKMNSETYFTTYKFSCEDVKASAQTE